MSPMNDAELIEIMGGATAVARRLGFNMPHGARRVHNWIKRGIPLRVKVDNARLFRKVTAQHLNSKRSVSEIVEAAE